MLRLIPAEIRNNPLALLFVGAVAGYFFAKKGSPVPAPAPVVDAQAKIMQQSKQMMEQAQDLISSI